MVDRETERSPEVRRFEVYDFGVKIGTAEVDGAAISRVITPPFPRERTVVSPDIAGRIKMVVSVCGLAERSRSRWSVFWLGQSLPSGKLELTVTAGYTRE